MNRLLIGFAAGLIAAYALGLRMLADAEIREDRRVLGDAARRYEGLDWRTFSTPLGPDTTTWTVGDDPHRWPNT